MTNYDDNEYTTDDETFFRRVIDDLIPKIDSSACTVSLIPNDPSHFDPKIAVELGITLLLDKPLILVIEPGVPVSDHLRRASDAIVEYGPHTAEGIRDALDRIVKNQQE